MGKAATGLGVRVPPGSDHGPGRPLGRAGYRGRRNDDRAASEPVRHERSPKFAFDKKPAHASALRSPGPASRFRHPDQCPRRNINFADRPQSPKHGPSIPTEALARRRNPGLRPPSLATRASKAAMRLEPAETQYNQILHPETSASPWGWRCGPGPVGNRRDRRHRSLRSSSREKKPRWGRGHGLAADAWPGLALGVVAKVSPPRRQRAQSSVSGVGPQPGE